MTVDVTASADAVVVGAGPAGAAAAIRLAEVGADVVLLDKATFPRDKICGDGLTTGALRLLEQLGVRPESVASWTPVSDVHVSSPSGRVATFPLPPPGQGTYAAIARRMDLDAAIVDRARSVGVTVVEGTTVVGASQDADGVTLELVTPAGIADGAAHEHSGAAETAGQSRLRAPYVIAADGMWSPLRKHLGTAQPGYLGQWHAFRQYFSGTGPLARQLWVWFEPDLLPGYAWSFPLTDGRANVGFGIQRGGEIPTKAMKALWPELLARPHIARVLGPEAVPEARHQAWPIPAQVDGVTLTAGRVLWVGDAAAATDPMTGEGIGQALLSGVLAADSVTTGKAAGTADVRRRYEQAIRRELTADHKMSMLLIRVLRHRRGAEFAVRLADLMPWARRNFGRWLFEDEPRAIALTPRRWHRRLLARDGAYR